MKKLSLLLILFITSLFISSCTSTQPIQNSKNTSYNKSQKIITTAKKYLGTPYKWAGTNRKGMDCSGLVYTTFLENNYTLPRNSREQSKVGKTIAAKKTIPGDLIFFKSEKSNNITHVGIVINNSSNNIEFIHASSSRGVMISSLNDKYWNNNYSFAKRVLNNNHTQNIKKKNLYKVKKGDTLYSISKKFNISVTQLKKLNHLSSNNIDIGMLLQVY